MAGLNRVNSVAIAAPEDAHARFPLAIGFLLAVTATILIFRDLQASGLALIVLMNFVFFVMAWRAAYGGRISYLDPGIIFATVVMVYLVVPLLTTAALNYNFGLAQDGRLSAIALTDDLFSTTVANANFILAGFGAGYILVRAPRMPALRTTSPETPAALWIMLGVAAAVQAGLAFAGRGGDNYGDEYLLVQSLPVAVIQLLNVISNVLYVALFGLIAEYTRRGRFSIVAMLVAGGLAFFILTTGARTPLVLILLAGIVCWDHLHKRIKPLTIGILFTLMILGFLALGAMRGGSDSVATAFSQSEFMAVFVTALDIRQVHLTNSSLDMNATLLIGDLLRLVPQQLLPFEKVDPASWYVSTFYPTYAAQGGGFAFGMLAETALTGGGGWAVVRGLALGGTLGGALNLLTRRDSIWPYIIYLWLITSIYQSFRDTTFTLIGRFMFQLGPALLLCAAVVLLLRSSAGRPVGGGSIPPIR